VFSWSYRRLSEPAAGLFRLLAAHPGPDFSASAAASLLGVPPARMPPLLDELTRARLITEPACGRYAFHHDLLRAYATDLHRDRDTETERRAASDRLFDHYLHTAYAASLLLNPYRDLITVAPPRSGVTPDRLTDYGDALAWFTAEHPVLLAAVRHCAANGFDVHCWQLAWAIWTFLAICQRRHELLEILEVAQVAARKVCDQASRAVLHRLTARTYWFLNRHDDAVAELEHALALSRHLRDPIGQAHARVGFAMSARGEGRQRRVLRHAEVALRLYRAGGHQAGQANTLHLIGLAHIDLGSYRPAVASLQTATTLSRRVGYRILEPYAWLSLADAHRHLGQHRRAIACCQNALALFRNIDDQYGTASVHDTLGDIHHATGNRDAATAAWRRALDLLTTLDHPEAATVRTKMRRLGPVHPR